MLDKAFQRIFPTHGDLVVTYCHGREQGSLYYQPQKFASILIPGPPKIGPI